jgi:hypothetical protein
MHVFSTKKRSKYHGFYSLHPSASFKLPILCPPQPNPTQRDNCRIIASPRKKKERQRVEGRGMGGVGVVAGQACRDADTLSASDTERPWSWGDKKRYNKIRIDISIFGLAWHFFFHQNALNATVY